MIVWRGALARTGGTVCIRIVEAVLAHHGVTPRRITTDDLRGCRVQVIRHADGGRTVRLPPGMFEDAVYVGGSDGFFHPVFAAPPFRVFYIRRDLRHALASYKRLMRNPDFDTLLRLARDLARKGRHMEGLPDERCLKLAYEADILNLASGVRRLADFIGHPVDAATVAALAERYDRTGVRQYLARLEQQARKVLAPWRAPAADTKVVTLALENGREETLYVPRPAVIESSERLGRMLVRRPDGAEQRLWANAGSRTWRLGFEGFQSGFIGDDGDWRDAFTGDEQARLTEAVAPYLEAIGITP